MAPPKFKDLSKSNDDAHSKDYHVDCFNTKAKHSFNLGDMGTGDATYKLDYNTSLSKVKPEMEIKCKLGADWPKFMQGVSWTKTFSNSGDFKNKVEKSCASGSKMTFNFVQNMGTFAVSKPAFTFDNSGDKHAVQVNINPAADFKGLNDASLNFTYTAGSANIGAHAGYKFADGSLSHHLKLAKSANGLSFCLGLKEANQIELTTTKALNKDMKSPCGCFSWTTTNVHNNTSYDLAKSDWASSLVLEYDNIKAFGFDLHKGKSKINLKTLDYSDRASLKINDSLSLNLGCQTKMDAGFFSNLRIGAGLDFAL